MTGYCCDADKALKVYKNYPTEFADVDWLSILFESEAIDLTGFRATFILGDFQKEWTDLTDGIIINLTDEETGALPVGLNYATLIVEDTSGNSKPFSTAIPVEVLTWVEGDQEIDTYNMTVNALLDNETQMVIKIETAKVSLDWVLEKIEEHNNSNISHPYILELIDDEKQARINVDNQLNDRIDSVFSGLSNYRTAAQQDVIDNNQNVAIASKQNQLSEQQLNAVNSGITSQKVSLYDNHIANSTIHVTAQEKQIWDNKQDEIQDLSTIRSNALAGKNARDTIYGYGNIVTHNTSEFATSEQGDLADTALQPTDVINNTSSNDTDKPLSANMGKSLQEQVDNLKARGRFLALWNCATGLAESNPPSGTYTYQSGDYFIIGVVASAGGTNYRPNGSSYTTGVASTTVETAQVDTDDVYYYDGNVWRLQVNTQKEIGFVNIAGSPYDNTNLANALNDKQDEIDSSNKLSADLVDDTTTTNKFVTASDKTTWNGKQDELVSGTNIKTVNSTSLLGSGNIDTLPSQTGNNGKYLTTNGTTASWANTPTEIPSQSGQSGKYLTTDGTDLSWGSVDLSGKVPYTGATGAVDLNAQDLKNVDNLAVGTATVDSNEKILSVGQNRFVSNNNNGLFISSTTSQARKGMYGVPMALEIQFNSNNQGYSYPLGFHDMNKNNNGGQFLFTSFSSNISAASGGDVMVENDKGGLIFNTGNSKSGAKMRFTVGNWQSTPQLTLTANCVGIKNLNPSSSYALDVTGDINSSTDVKVNGVSLKLPSQSGNSGKFLTTNGTTAYWETVQAGGDANVQYTNGGGTQSIDLSTLYIDSQGATYGFSYDSMSDTIKNNNVQVDESFAYGYIELNLENDGDVTISFSQNSEQNYDFGEISELDQYLNQDNYADTDYVAWSGQEYGSVSDSITFSNVTAGYHFFTIKYIKDSSTESGSDTFEITGIETSGGGAGSLIDTDTQEEIPLSQINDMPQVLQDIRDEIPDTSDFVTINTKQMMTAPKAITGTDTPWGSDQVQKNLFMAVSNSNTTPVVEWIGRSMFGANNLTFLMGTINQMAALGAHSWTSAKEGTGAAWADMYFNPDGDKAIKIGGSPMVGRPSIMVIQNLGQVTTGTVKINRRATLTQTANYKDVACWDDAVTKFDFTSISGYSAGSNQMLTHDTSGNLKWVNI